MTYLALIALVIVGFLLIKRVAGCLFRTVVTLVLAAAFVIIWFYLKGNS